MSNNIEHLPKLYAQLADWWPILSSPDDYKEEAGFYWRAIITESETKPSTMLELGCGGGNNASHLKEQVQLTLIDLSPGMLQVSLKLNPECEHIQGDMRKIRLQREFDAVFIHDAIVYMTSEDDLKSAISTAFEHCRSGGVALFAPDCTRETFVPRTEHGGHDVEDRGLRYLDWVWDPDPDDSEYVSDMVYVLREKTGEVRCVHDRHNCGLFSREDWLRIISDIGFQAKRIPFEHCDLQDQILDVFIGIKP